MNDDSLRASGDLLNSVIHTVIPIIRIVGGLLIFMAIVIIIYEISMKKKAEERMQAMNQLTYIVYGALILGLILEITGFLVSSIIK